MNEKELEREVDESEFQQIAEEVSKIDKKELEKMREEVTSYEDNGIEYVDVPLDAQQIKEKYALLRKLEIEDAYNTLQLNKMVEQLESDLPNRLLQDTIDKFEKDLAEGMITKGNNGIEKREPATEAEKKMMEIEVKYLKQELEQGLPTKNLRNQISQFKINLEKEEAPGNNIKKLRKEIRNKKETVLSSRYQMMNPKKYVG